jgi:hypothetical protein
MGGTDVFRMTSTYCSGYRSPISGMSAPIHNSMQLQARVLVTEHIVHVPRFQIAGIFATRILGECITELLMGMRRVEQ